MSEPNNKHMTDHTLDLTAAADGQQPCENRAKHPFILREIFSLPEGSGGNPFPKSAFSAERGRGGRMARAG